MDNLTWIAAFVRVVEAKSFAAAADQLGMTSSGVSRAVSRLEESLGARLLFRTTRSLRLTEDGAAFYERCTQILTDLTDLAESIGDSGKRPQGRIRIEMPASLGRMFIVPNLANFQARYPDLKVQLGMSDRTADLVEDGIDCAIRVGELQDSNMIARRIGVIRMVTAAAPSYLAKHGAPKSIDDLKNHQCVNYFYARNGRAYEWQFDTPGGRIQVPIDAALMMNDVDALIASAEIGLGIVQLGSFTLDRALRAGTLVKVLEHGEAIGPPISIIYPQKRHLPARVRVFIDWVIELFEGQYPKFV
jgi:LysR family transcriptional regulator, regulator for bpeEF and oprC